MQKVFYQISEVEPGWKMKPVSGSRGKADDTVSNLKSVSGVVIAGREAE